MAELPRWDYHTRAKYLGCANGTMWVPAIVRECERNGVTSLGITDHLNTLDKLELHWPIRRDVAGTGVCFAFGSDAHDIQQLQDARTSRQVGAQLHLPADRIWSPSGKPMAGRNAA